MKVLVSFKFDLESLWNTPLVVNTRTVYPVHWINVLIYCALKNDMHVYVCLEWGACALKFKVSTIHYPSGGRFSKPS